MNVSVTAVRRQVVEDFASADVAHDVAHLDRVAELAARIALELGADAGLARVARVAAYVHDYHRLLEAGREGRRPVAPSEAAGAVEGVLGAAAVPAEWFGVVLAAVATTERYRCAGDVPLASVSPVGAAVHDADDLDAIGAIGVARAFAFGGLLGEPLWDPVAGVEGRYRPGTTASVLAHLYEKLVHLEHEMLTEPGRRLAAERAQVLHRFAADFRAEWGGFGVGPWAEWDETTGFLTVQGAGEGLPGARLTFRCRAELTLAGDHVVGVRLDGAPGGSLLLRLLDGELVAERMGGGEGLGTAPRVASAWAPRDPGGTSPAAGSEAHGASPRTAPSQTPPDLRPAPDTPAGTPDLTHGTDTPTGTPDLTQPTDTPTRTSEPTHATDSPAAAPHRRIAGSADVELDLRPDTPRPQPPGGGPADDLAAVGWVSRQGVKAIWLHFVGWRG